MQLVMLSTSGVAPTAAATYLWLPLPIGSHLKIAAARNSTKAGGKTLICMAESSQINQSTPVVTGDPTGLILPLNGSRDWQEKAWADWFGDLSIGPQLNYILVSFATPDAGDQLKFVVGVEQ